MFRLLLAVHKVCVVYYHHDWFCCSKHNGAAAVAAYGVCFEVAGLTCQEAIEANTCAFGYPPCSYAVPLILWKTFPGDHGDICAQQATMQDPSMQDVTSTE